MAKLLMWSDRSGSFFWACCALNGFPNRGFASISSLAKQRPGPPGVRGTGLMDLMDRWITLTLTNQTPASALAAGLLGSRGSTEDIFGNGRLRRKGGKKKDEGEET